MKKDDSKQEKIDEVELEQAEDQVDKTGELETRVGELENQVKRVLADYQNLEKRNREERVRWIETANKELILRLLPVLDTLSLASIHSKDQGLSVSLQQFLNVLKDEGITKIETNGKQFDPITMECIATEPGEENKVLEELRAGFQQGDIIIRPAQVKVGKE